MKQIYYIIILWALSTLSVQAQKLAGSSIGIENQSVTLLENGQLLVGMDLIVPADLKITSDRVATLTPVLQSADGTHNKLLPAVHVYGRRQAIVHRREHRMPTDAYSLLNRKNETIQTIHYTTRVAYASWMNGASLELQATLCGCGNYQEEEDQRTLASINFERYAVKPVVAFVAPEVEAVKSRAAEGRAYLDFPVNKTNILVDFRRNPEELAKIKATIDLVKNDKNTHITELGLTGYASPEGAYAANARLAQGRAEALKSYLLSQYDLKGNMIRVKAVAEDWAGLRAAVSESDLTLKHEILSIIDGPDANEDAKEQKLKRLDGGKLYPILLEAYYPALRRSDYVVNYVVRDFTVEEAMAVIDTNPEQLSLDEMYRIAQTYEKGSKKFKEVFDVAVRVFPNDPIANINAAAIELREGDLQQAAHYLSKADAQASATLNNRGVLALLQGDLNGAEEYFRKALSIGSTEAESNLNEISNKRKDDTKFKIDH